MFFKNAKESKKVVESYMKDLSPLNQTRMSIVLSQCKNKPNKEQIFDMTTNFRLCLWDIPEAVEMGFLQWMKEKIPERIAALQYYEALK